MIRRTIAPREGWQKRVESLGLIIHHVQGLRYWDESACWELLPTQVDILEEATEALHALCVEAAQHVIDHNRFEELGIPALAIPAIRQTWEQEPPSFYGRMDLAYDGISPPKLLEYNADTPTSLLEAAVIQWDWLESVHPGYDQFNSLHDQLLDHLRTLAPAFAGQTLWFAHADDVEDLMTVTYLRDLASQAGIQNDGMWMQDIGWNDRLRCFVDRLDQPLQAIFKLYPWEWMWHEEFAANLGPSHVAVKWVEPAYKMLWSNKGLLAILWELFPGHPNLLPTFFDTPRDLAYWARKPLLSREGANITLQTPHGLVQTAGPYDASRCIYQQWHPLAQDLGAHAVIGSWVVDGSAAGIGIRESWGPITDNLSRFVPHYFVPNG